MFVYKLLSMTRSGFRNYLYFLQSTGIHLYVETISIVQQLTNIITKTSRILKRTLLRERFTFQNDNSLHRLQSIQSTYILFPAFPATRNSASNQEVSMDLLWLEKKPVSLFICGNTHFDNPIWIASKPAGHFAHRSTLLEHRIWCALLLYCSGSCRTKKEWK